MLSISALTGMVTLETLDPAGLDRAERFPFLCDGTKYYQSQRCLHVFERFAFKYILLIFFQMICVTRRLPHSH